MVFCNRERIRVPKCDTRRIRTALVTRGAGAALCERDQEVRQ